MGRVLVVGAGPSGLVAAKEARAKGLSVVCYEADSALGGLWRYNDKEAHSSVYRTTVINSSKEMMCYSDFPAPASFAPYMHHSKCLEYFELYADHFQLRPLIRFNTRVVHVTPAPDYQATGRYRVKSQGATGRIEEEEFDAVLVCSGHHWKAKWPQFKNQAAFQGRVMHAHAYKDQHGFENLNVLVVGVGNSGLDISVELSRCAKQHAELALQTYLSTRSGAWILTRQGPNGLPADYGSITRQRAGRIPEELVESELQRQHDFGLYGLQPNHHLSQAHPAVNGEIIGRINTGTLLVRPNIREFKAHSVVYENGQEDAIDAVIFATGYERGEAAAQIAFPYLDDACGVKIVRNEVNLYKYVFPPHLPHPTLAFVGLIQPIGSIMPISEMQCRWVMGVLAGKADIDAKREAMRKRYLARERHTIQVDYLEYCDELAGLVGCMPDLKQLRATDPELAHVAWTKGAVPAQYRLMGPDTWPGARDAILQAESRIKAAVQGVQPLAR